MPIQKPGHVRRKKKALEFWFKVAEDLKSKTPAEVAAANINPKTGKPYSVKHIYGIIKSLNQMGV